MPRRLEMLSKNEIHEVSRSLAAVRDMLEQLMKEELTRGLLAEGAAESLRVVQSMYSRIGELSGETERFTLDRLTEEQTLMLRMALKKREQHLAQMRETVGKFLPIGTLDGCDKIVGQLVFRLDNSEYREESTHARLDKERGHAPR